ncbi:MAG TPA: ketoacyl-ACP synthase III [Methylomirabilota bacterium]|nr:ketoacyl-ACP synthase III [Methylomirabilota bacterium]
MRPTADSPIITGRGMYVPDDVLSNEDIARLLDPRWLATWVDESPWCQQRIRVLRAESALSGASRDQLDRRAFVDYVHQRIGIRRRHVVDRSAILERRRSTAGVFGSDLGARAAQQALDAAGVSAAEVDVVICGTSSPDRVYPATAVEIQDRIGAGDAYGYDLLAACSSFVYGLEMARGLLVAGLCRRALVVAAEYFTCAVDYRDPSNSFFWGDAAAAVLMEAAHLGSPKGGYQLLDGYCRSQLSQNIRTGLGGTRPFVAGCGIAPASGDAAEPGGPDYPYFYQNGPMVYREVIPLVARATKTILERNGCGVGDIRLFMFHQASTLVLDGIKKRLFKDETPSDRVPMNLVEYGNTSSCGAAICLVEEAVMGAGELACMTAFGGGYTIGAALLRKVAPA